MGSTWNTEIMTRLGKAVGDECLHLNVGGWYAPGMNIHRSPFGGRNFEYYSEDRLLSRKIAAAVCRGSAQKGVTIRKPIEIQTEDFSLGRANRRFGRYI